MPLSIVSHRSVSAEGPYSTLHRLLGRQRAAIETDRVPTVSVRKERLKRLLALITDNDAILGRAIDSDFGRSSPFGCGDPGSATTVRGIGHARRHIGRWMAQRPRMGDLDPSGGAAVIYPEPLGIVGVVPSWYSPLTLTAGPLVSILAAGNRAIIKPSEHTPAFAEAFADLVRRYFDEAEVATVTGGFEIAEALCAQPLDHLLFTGADRDARILARTAAEHLVPTTLSRGGKSPAIVTEGLPLSDAAMGVALAKFATAGQSDAAPDYALVPRGRGLAFAEAIIAAAGQLYPDLNAPAYPPILPGARLPSLEALLAEVRATGARIETQQGSVPSGKMAPTAVVAPPSFAGLMRDEIFGPILPIIEYDGIADAVRRIRAVDNTPRTLHLFGQDKTAAAALLDAIGSEAATVYTGGSRRTRENKPAAMPAMSGHLWRGKTGFRTFSRARAVTETGAPGVTDRIGTARESLIRRVSDLLSRF